MRPLIKQYISSLKERNELDAVLPDLLSELGFQVYSRPAVGVKQYGVDVAAVGADEDGRQKVFLFSVKPGNLTRGEWVAPKQGLSDSIVDIFDGYIPFHIPPQFKDLPIVICLCLGGHVDQGVTLQVNGRIETLERQHRDRDLRIVIWDGDHLTNLVIKAFVREDLMPPPLRGKLRKSLALLDEPDAAFQHFSSLIEDLFAAAQASEKARLTALRQMNLCVWIVFVWAWDADNLDVPQRGSALVTLRVWDLVKDHFGGKTKLDVDFANLFEAAVKLHVDITTAYCEKMLPATKILNCLGMSALVSNSVDVNLRLFDVVGRLGIQGLWLQRLWSRAEDKTSDEARELQSRLEMVRDMLLSTLANNSALNTPLTDNQAADINIACMFLYIMGEHDELVYWIGQIVGGVSFAYKLHDRYPSQISDYRQLLSHPKQKTDAYRKKVTEASILFPTLGVWASILGDKATLKRLAEFCEKELDHCNFQVWLPDTDSEEKLFSSDDNYHGIALDSLAISADGVEPLKKIREEIAVSDQLTTLSPTAHHLLALIATACRQQGLPLPPQFWLLFENDTGVASRIVDCRRK